MFSALTLVVASGFLQLVSGQQFWYSEKWKDFSFSRTTGNVVTDYSGLEWNHVKPQGCCSTLPGQAKIRDAKFRVSMVECQVSGRFFLGKDVRTPKKKVSADHFFFYLRSQEYCILIGFERCKGIEYHADTRECQLRHTLTDFDSTSNNDPECSCTLLIAFYFSPFLSVFWLSRRSSFASSWRYLSIINSCGREDHELY